jgi:hypothetical protein
MAVAAYRIRMSNLSEAARIDPSGARRLVRECDLCVQPLKGSA